MKSIYQFSIVVLAVFILNACNKTATETATAEAHQEEENTVELTAEQFKTANILTGNVEMKALSGTIKVNGMLDVPPQNLVSISAPTSGYIKSTDLLQGKYVKKGAVIATLNNPELISMQQDLLEAKGQLQEVKAQIEYAELEMNRQKELADENVNAKKTYQKANSDFNAMKGKINSLEGKIGAISAKLKALGIDPSKISSTNFVSTVNIYSPINGYVTQVSTNIGAFVSQTDALFKIVDTQHLHAELTIFEKDVPKLKIGQKVRFTLANETKERMASIHLIGREIDKDRTVRVHCHLDQEDMQLIPGMYLKALVESGSNSVPALPEKAIIEFEGNKYVFVANSDEKNAKTLHYEMVKVSTGVTELGYTEVIFDDNFNWKVNKIVINGAYDLLSKMKNSEEGE